MSGKDINWNVSTIIIYLFFSMGGWETISIATKGSESKKSACVLSTECLKGKGTVPSGMKIQPAGLCGASWGAAFLPPPFSALPDNSI